MRRLTLALAALVALTVPAVADGHAERATLYPSRSVGEVPALRTTGTARVVCKADSAKRLRTSWAGKGPKRTKQRAALLKQLKRCRFEHIQQAVDAAKTGDRILIMPGVYREEPSRAIAVKDPKCEGPTYWEDSGDNHTEDGRVPTFLHQHDCPNARNLIAIIGDSLDADRTCDRKCNLVMEGLGRRARDVVIQGDRKKPDVLRADRADGFQLRNVTVEEGAYNAIDVVETNGFRLSKLVARNTYHYGILTFTSDHGLYEDIEAYGNGDSGVYPGSGPEAHCRGFGIEVRRVNSYGNTLGASGTAGNGTWTHDSDFHGNAAGIANDSFAAGHPGMPQDCSKWTRNEIHSNNWNIFEDDNEAYCNSTTFAQRRKDVVCPVFQVVVGVGFMLYGVNDNTFAENHIYDQWRSAVRMFGVPSVARGETDPAKLLDTSHGNKFTTNTFGMAPDGTRMPNGLDVFWDEQGLRNCWEGNVSAPGVGVTSDPPSLPTCASGGSLNPVGNTLKLAADLPCISWHPRTNPDPPGCTWFTTPPKPGSAAAKAAAARAASGAGAPAALAPLSISAPSQGARGPLTWADTPRGFAPAELPQDRVITGQLRNTSGAPLDVSAAAARMYDETGAEVRGVATFASGFAHGLYSPRVEPKEAEPLFESVRLGRRIVLAPGATTPFTVAWRLTPGARPPSRVTVGTVSIALPATT
ncbi:hypothetical protein DSM112329_03377 [Paraconexibacter sp. AEG42_29]|uniref:Right handed beta helix domain-containing protein n=1 Tax=Paraconexibacter sp. AEG42_29 TaxID=2997339 RepID=A0AAU7AY24_9ACTN